MKYVNGFVNFLIVVLSILIVNCSYNQFDDTILYNIKWPGRTDEKLMENIDQENAVIGVTDKQERYFCSLPDPKETEKNFDSQYTGPNPVELLLPLFTQTTCSYRLESYWTYEVCHGKFVRQFHEERDGKKIKKQEYFLGRYDLVMQNELSRRLENFEINKNTIKTKKIEGMDIPYLQLNYTDGTVCDLIEKPRQTNVLYMCFEHGRSDIYSIKEISTCQYEAIIFTPLLCTHPLYRPKNSGEKDINCIPFEGAGKKPANLLELEAESFKLKHDQLLDDDQVLKKVFAVFSFDKSDGQEGEARLHVQIHPIDSMRSTTGSTSTPALESPKLRSTEVYTDMINFLSGESCLEGEKGYWKFEFCYGKYVNQFHEESAGTRIIIELGKFNLEEHKTWLRNNPSKKPKKGKSVSHFYSRGTFCDKANILRETEVRFVCVEKENVSPSSIILYLKEPQTCKYVLFVESPSICELMNSIDEYGIFNVKGKTIENPPSHDVLEF